MKLVSMLLLASASAQVGKTNLYRKPEPTATPAAINEVSTLKAAHGKPRPSEHSTGGGNLSFEYQTPLRLSFRASESPVVLPSTPHRLSFARLPLGTVVDAEILESVIAFPEMKTPVRATVRSGELKGCIFLGEASLERNSKRITIEFRKFRPKSKTEVYGLTANALDIDGVLGVEGEHHSGQTKFFAAELLAAAAAGFADASIERSTTAFGQVQDQPSLDTSSKKALTSALSRTADRFADKVRSSPEYSVFRGPVAIRILIQEQPKLIE